VIGSVSTFAESSVVIYIGWLDLIGISKTSERDIEKYRLMSHKNKSQG